MQELCAENMANAGEGFMKDIPVGILVVKTSTGSRGAVAQARFECEFHLPSVFMDSFYGQVNRPPLAQMTE